MIEAPAIILPRQARGRIWHQRTICMPPGKEPEWLAPQYRDNYVERCIQLAQKMLACEDCRKRRKMLQVALRKFQRGNFTMFPAGIMALLGPSNCTFTQSTIPNLFEFNISPTNSHTQARLHSDGNWYSNAGTTTSFGGVDGTWQGGCAVAEYDTQWTQNSGDTENSSVTIGTSGVFTVATTSAAVGYSVTGLGALFGAFFVACRDGTSLDTLFTDSFSMDCEVETRN